MQQNKLWLIIAQSGRALAASAARAGYMTFVMDRFGDLDTRAITSHFHLLEDDNKEFNINDLLDTVNKYSNSGFAGVITGSGLEAHPSVLDFISQKWPLYGNDAETVMTCKDPVRFFGLLEKLQIPYPEVVYEVCAMDGEWLIKLTGGTGGCHISGYTQGGKLPEGSYLQKKMDGRSLSVVFLADGRNCQVIGINEIWPVAPENHDYRYLGAVTLTEIESRLYGELEAITHTLVQALKLKGLCGLDVIIDEHDQCHVLEINPRPTATFELHEHNGNLFEAHIQACQGRLQTSSGLKNICFAHKVIYAKEDFIVPEFDWPIWTTDRPAVGTQTKKHDPVCMIQIEAPDVQQIHQLLDIRTQALQQLMPLHKLAA